MAANQPPSDSNARKDNLPDRPQHKEDTSMPSEVAQDNARPTDGQEYLEQKQLAEETAGWAPPTESGNPEKPSDNTSLNETSGTRKP